jgi:hypothetical protein
MSRKLSLFALVILLFGCAAIDNYIEGLTETEENIVFSGKPTNRFFNYQQLTHQNVAMLPIRSSMGGSDDRLNSILVQAIKEKLPGINLITDDQADSYFTDNDIWDDYFSYVTFHATKGLVEIDTLIELYSQLKATTVFSVTSDFRFSGIEGMYPRNFNTFASLQIFDFKNRQIIWEGMVEIQVIIPSQEEEDQIVKKAFKRVSEKLLSEVVR